MAQKNNSATDAADDQSMEEILQSIRRIIAEEGDSADQPQPSTDDVLELTEIVEEQADPDPLATIDAIMAGAQAPEPVIPMPAPAEAPRMQEQAPKAPEPRAFEPRELPPFSAEPAQAEQLLSDSTAAAAISSLSRVRDSAQRASEQKPHTLTFRSGTTVEDLILEALRPMLKEWLDAHLPQTVERIVQREIHRLASEVE